MDTKIEYVISKIPPNIWNDMPKVVQNAWLKEAFYYQKTPLDFAIEFITFIRNTPSQYKKELLELLKLKEKII